MAVTIEDIGIAFKQSLVNGTQTKEGILQDIVNLFVANFAEGIVKLMVIIIPVIVLFKILDFLMEFIRNPDRSVKMLLNVTIQTILHYVIVLFLAEFWVKYFYQDMFILITQKLPMEILNLQEPMTLDRMTRVFTAPFIVYSNILQNNSEKIVELIQSGATQSEINKELYKEGLWTTLAKGFKFVASLVNTALSFLNDAIGSMFNPNKAGNFLLRGFAFIGTWTLIVKITKLIGTIIFAYLFAGLSIAVSLAMGTFHFLFTSEKINGLGGGINKLINIIINSVAKFSILILFIQVANSDIIPFSPIWVAKGMAKIQDSKTVQDFNNPQTFYYIMGYWLFMWLFAKVFQETTEQISIT